MGVKCMRVGSDMGVGKTALWALGENTERMNYGGGYGGAEVRSRGCESSGGDVVA
jgi:hypothetical protein